MAENADHIQVNPTPPQPIDPRVAILGHTAEDPNRDRGCDIVFHHSKLFPSSARSSSEGSASVSGAQDNASVGLGSRDDGVVVVGGDFGVQLTRGRVPEPSCGALRSREYGFIGKGYGVVVDYGVGEPPSDIELKALERVAAPIPWKAFTIAFVELVERMSYYGTVAVFNNFIQSPRPAGSNTGAPVDPAHENAQPGALGIGQKASTGITRFNQFFIYLMPILGAWVADTYLGRFKTIVYAIIIAEVGHIILTVSATPIMLEKPVSALGMFIFGLVIMGVGTGTFKPNISPMVMEQIPQDGLVVRINKKGMRVIEDPSVTATRIYNWFYLFINIGALIGQVAMVYAERYIGFYLAYLIPTIFFITTIPILLICNKFYCKAPPGGSVLGPAVRLLFLGIKGRIHLNPIATFKHLRDGTYWENIKPSRFGDVKPAWMNFDDAWVDEVARGWKACGVFLWLPLYWCTYNQISDNMLSQAKTMQLHGVPNDLLQNLDPLCIIILVPIFDFLIYPALRKSGINLTPIKKIFMGFMLGTAAMIWAAVLQHHIYLSSPCGPHTSQVLSCKSPINVWAQTGVYILVAASEIFASVASLEYAFTKAPVNMRSLVQAFSLFTTATSAALGQAFVPLSDNPMLVWNYGITGVVAFVSGWAFWWVYWEADRDEDRLNMLPVGKVAGAAVGVAVVGNEK